MTAHLYKLLVYEKGGFFLPHRDGEKLDRMVATLVIVLPSIHEGGALILSHDAGVELRHNLHGYLANSSSNSKRLFQQFVKHPSVISPERDGRIG